MSMLAGAFRAGDLGAGPAPGAEEDCNVPRRGWTTRVSRVLEDFLLCAIVGLFINVPPDAPADTAEPQANHSIQKEYGKAKQEKWKNAKPSDRCKFCNCGRPRRGSPSSNVPDAHGKRARPLSEAPVPILCAARFLKTFTALAAEPRENHRCPKDRGGCAGPRQKSLSDTVRPPTPK